MQVDPNGSQDASTPTAPAFTPEQYAKLLALISPSTPAPMVNIACMLLASFSILSKLWVIDSGATNHIVSDSSFLTSSTTLDSPKKVTLPNEKEANITHIGAANLNSSLSINDALYIPSFQHNLLSVSKLTKSLNCALIFYPNKCILQDLSMKMEICLDKEQGGLYIFQPDFSSIAALSISPQSFNLWHCCLGHPSSSQLLYLSKTIPDVSFSNKCLCQVCPIAKQTRLSFSLSSILCVAPFELIHIDIWGAYRVKSHSGASYFLTLVDDFFCATWVYLMQHKSQSQYYIQTFISFIKTRYNTHIKRIRTDNGLEFFHNEFQHFLHLEGIIHEHSWVETP